MAVSVREGVAVMMLQNETAASRKRSKTNWRLSRPQPYDVEYLMRLGDINRQTALALIAKHGANRHAVNADLIAMRRKRR
jgi:hypothetical protein